MILVVETEADCQHWGNSIALSSLVEVSIHVTFNGENLRLLRIRRQWDPSKGLVPENY